MPTFGGLSMYQVKQNFSLSDTINGVSLIVGDHGYAQVDAGWCGAEVYTPFNKLYLMESGEGILTLDGETVTMTPGNAYLIPTRTSYSYHCDHAMSKLYFHFNLLKPDQYDVFQGINEIMQLPIPAGLLQSMRKHYYSESLCDGMLIKEQLYHILNRFAGQYSLAQEKLPVYSEHVADTINYILNNLSASLRVDELTKRSPISKSYLEKLFHKEVGVSMGQYIDDQLMSKAQRLLDQTDESVACISQILGFSDPYYFSRRFKKLCGTTPIRYRHCRRLDYMGPL